MTVRTESDFVLRVVIAMPAVLLLTLWVVVNSV